MRMRQSLAEWERAFVKEISLDRYRRESLRRAAERRSARREAHRRQKQGSWRFLALVLTVIMTAAVVTVIMFRTLYVLLG
jgi:hypothetical protein